MRFTARKIPNPLFSLSSVSYQIRRLIVKPRHCSSLPQRIDYDDYFENQKVLPDYQYGFDAHSHYSSLIDGSTHFSLLNQIHAQLIICGLHSSGLLISKLINACSKHGEIHYARQVFDEFPHPNVVMWNATIGVFCNYNMLADAANMYVRMLAAGVKPDSFTFVKVLKGCSSVRLIELGRAVHGHIYRLGLEFDKFVQNVLVAFYAKCGRIDCAKSIFDCLSDRTIISWTAIISGYAQNEQPAEALRVFSEMMAINVKPDWINVVSVLKACTDLDDLEDGKSLHGYVIKLGLASEEDLQIALTAMYAKCGQVIAARYLFDQMASPNVILWNAMISGYAKNGYADEAVELFKIMVTNNIKPDSITLRAAILACAQVGSLDLARWMDNYVTTSDFRSHLFVKTALIDMYAKCGSLDFARQVFDGIPCKDVVVWSAMIVGYGLHGLGREAIDLYGKMRQAGVLPNDVTFVGLLTACKNSGLVKEGWNFFHSMKGHGIEPLHPHYACVVDLLGRAGYLEEAFKFICKMPIQPRLTVWGALLAACKVHRHVKMGEYAAQHLFSINPYDTGQYVQLSNLYAAARMWNHVRNVRGVMKERGLSKDFGYSLIEVNGKLQVFRMGDNAHPMSKEIFRELSDLERRLKDAGFTLDTESNLHDLSSEEMHESLCNHSERLAIAYGLITTPSGSMLRIIKNLRVCVNCHNATKLISKITNREIVVRDANRFHHFKDGLCSCGDYW